MDDSTKQRLTELGILLGLAASILAFGKEGGVLFLFTLIVVGAVSSIRSH